MILAWILTCQTLPQIDKNSIHECKLDLKPGRFIVLLCITAGVRSDIL